MVVKSFTIKCIPLTYHTRYSHWKREFRSIFCFCLEKYTQKGDSCLNVSKPNTLIYQSTGLIEEISYFRHGTGIFPHKHVGIYLVMSHACKLTLTSVWQLLQVPLYWQNCANYLNIKDSIQKLNEPNSYVSCV